MAVSPVASARLTQAERRARTREALLEAAARGLSREGYGNLVLERVAREAGYTRGALYHLFRNKEDLALAVLSWVGETWRAEVGYLLDESQDPLGSLLAVARQHAIYCRRDVARVIMTLRVEFSGQDHPVGKALEEADRRLVEATSRLISAGRKDGRIPSGPPPRVVARALMGALEGLVIQVAGSPPHDALLAESAVRGVLGLAPRSSGGSSRA